MSQPPLVRTRQLGPWTLRERVPGGPGPHRLLLLVHGWTGDENSMWVFTSRLPQSYWLVAPRGLHTAPQGGYSWQAARSGSWPSIDDLRPSAEALLNDLLQAEHFPGAQLDVFDLAGFSQGAATSYTLALLHPQRVARLAGLAGFVPDGAGELTAGLPLLDKPVLVAHGRRDTIVPIERARAGAAILERAGASVSMCESDVGHKLGADCFTSLADFFAE